MNTKNQPSLSTLEEGYFTESSETLDAKNSLLIDSNKEKQNKENLNLLSKRYQKVKKDTFESISKLKFKVYLNILASKNNIIYVITDVTRKQIFYKISGGYTTKKGYLKNSQKVALKNMETIMEILSNLKVDYVFCTVKSAYGTKKHSPTTRCVLKLIESLKSNGFKIYEHVINTTARSVSYTRLQGGKKGRR